MQAVDFGTSGKAEAGDHVLLTFGGTVNPDLILSGWDGSATSITAHIQTYNSADWLFFYDAADTNWLSGLGGVDLVANYANPGGVTFPNSQMSVSGNTVTIVLGTPSGLVHKVHSAEDMIWWTYNGTITESGASDIDF